MRRLCLALLLAAVVAGCGGTRTVVRTVTGAPKPAGDQRLFGRIASLEREGDHYLLRFDPAWFLSGVAASVAQAQDQDTTCRPSACPPVANDNYVVDESRRLLTFVLPADTRGTVLTKGGPPGGTPVSATQLAELVAGTSKLELFESLSSGLWIVVHIDTVRSFAQQYRP